MQKERKNTSVELSQKSLIVCLIGDKSVNCNQKDIDRYKRIVAECFVGQTNLNKELVRNGLMLIETIPKINFIDEEFARENNLGMWNGTFIHPKI